MQAPEIIDHDISPLLVEELRLGRAVRFRAEGRSMTPFIVSGDVVVVTPLRSESRPLRPGDVLFYEHKPGRLRLHRLSRIRHLPNGVQRFRMRGDAPGQAAEEIASDCILGVLTSFEHRGRLHHARHPRHRWPGLWWPRLRSRLPYFRKTHDSKKRKPIDIAALRMIIDAVHTTLRQQNAPTLTTQPATQTENPINPHALIALARQHGVLALCAEALIQRCPAAEPEIRDVIRSLALIGENNRTFIAQALRELQSAGLNPLVVKGPALAALAYGNAAVRPYDDIDLLLKGPDRTRALEILQNIGWHDCRNTPPLAQRHLLRTTEDLALIHPRCEVGIELVHPDGILRDAAPSTTAGSCSFNIQDTAVNAPSEIEHFLYCAAHGAKHGYSRLIWLADLDRLSAAFTEADWTEVMAQAKSRRLTHILNLSVALTETLLKTPFPPRIKMMRGNPQWLATKTTTCLEAQNRGARHVETWRWWMGLQDTTGQRLNHFIRWLFVPTGADLGTFILPIWAHPAYFIFRPLRLLLRLVFRKPAPRLTWKNR